MKIPKFTNWVEFSEYKNFHLRGLPGVYLMANFSRKPLGIPDPLSKKVIYVGETTKQNLAKRLYQFSRSAFSRKSGHSGGWSYSNKFLKNRARKHPPVDLYVAFLPIDRQEEESSAYIKAIERVIIWKHYETNGSIPECNQI